MTMTTREKAQVHATRSHTCKCGRVVFGNGGWTSHRRACRMSGYFEEKPLPEPDMSMPVPKPPKPKPRPPLTMQAWLVFDRRYEETVGGKRVRVRDRELKKHIDRMYGGTCPDHGEYSGLVCPGGYRWQDQRPGREARWEDCGKPVLVENVSARDVLRLLRRRCLPFGIVEPTP